MYLFVINIVEEERRMREYMADKKPLVITHEDWQKHIDATDRHNYNNSLIKDLFLDSVSVHNHDSARYCCQSHRKCYHEAMKR